MSTLNLWHDPLADVEVLMRSLLGQPSEQQTGWTPASDVYRDGDDAVVRLELPGVDPAVDATVEIDRGHLVIRGERRPSRPEGQRGGVHELRYGSFRRTFRLPDHVVPEDLMASYDAGLLTVRVRGAHTPPRPVQVSIGTANPVAVNATEADATPTEQPVEQGSPAA